MVGIIHRPFFISTTLRTSNRRFRFGQHWPDWYILFFYLKKILLVLKLAAHYCVLSKVRECKQCNVVCSSYYLQNPSQPNPQQHGGIQNELAITGRSSSISKKQMFSSRCKFKINVGDLFSYRLQIWRGMMWLDLFWSITNLLTTLLKTVQQAHQLISARLHW